MRRVRSELTEHVGANPSPVQRALIERAVILTLKVAQLDAAIIAGEAFTVHDHNYALAWNRALGRVLAALGLEPAEVKPVDAMAALRAHVAARQGEVA